MTVDETGVDETVVDETGVDKLGINHINTSVGNELGLSYHKCQKPPPQPSIAEYLVPPDHPWHYGWPPQSFNSVVSHVKGCDCM